MRIRKFNESKIVDEVEDLLLDFKDEGFEVKTSYIEGKLLITCESETVRDKIKFLQDVLDLNSRIESLGFKSLKDKALVYTGDKTGANCRLKFEDPEVAPNKNVNNFDQFKQYLESVLDLKFFEWDTEVYLHSENDEIVLLMDIDKKNENFVIAFDKGDLSNIHPEYKNEIGKLIITGQEWSSINMWSVPTSDSEKYSNPELQKRAKEKVFGFDKRGIEAVEKCLELINK